MRDTEKNLCKLKQKHEPFNLYQQNLYVFLLNRKKGIRWLVKYLRKDNIILYSWLFLLSLVSVVIESKFSNFFFNFIKNPYLFWFIARTRTHSYPNHSAYSYRDTLLWLLFWFNLTMYGVSKWKAHLWKQKSVSSEHFKFQVLNMCKH